MYRTSVNAVLPGLVSDEQRSAATALYSMNFSVGMTVGPALTALFLLVGPPTLVLAANALTFVLSAAVLGSLRIDRGTPVHARAGVGGRAWVALDLDRRGRSVGESPPRCGRAAARVFGPRDTVGNLAYVVAFLSAGAGLALLGVRAVFALGGVALIALTAAAWIGLRPGHAVKTPSVVAEPA
jgi:hypothetical protein